MRNNDVIATFVNGGTNAKAKNLYIDGDKLMNYNTCLAQRIESGNIVVNMTKYSPTTSTIQNVLNGSIPAYSKIIVNNVPMGRDYLV